MATSLVIRQMSTKIKMNCISDQLPFALQLNNKHLSHIFSVGQEFESGLTEWFLPGCLLRLHSRSQLGSSLLKASMGLEDLLPRWLTHMVNNLLLAVAMWRNCSSVLTTWQLASLRASDPKESQASCWCPLCPYLRNHRPSFLHYLIVDTDQLYLLQDCSIQGGEYQEARLIESHVGRELPQLLLHI